MSGYPVQAEVAAAAPSSLQRIALAVDGSHESERAVAITKQLAKALGAEVTVIHFREPAAHPRAAVPFQESAGQMLALVTRVVNDLAGDGIEVAGDIENSTVLAEAGPIARTAERYGAGLIVVGSRGFSTGRALIQGSVSHDLIHATRIPVLIVH